MSRNLFAKAYFLGCYITFSEKSNSDLCCFKFRPTTEIVYFRHRTNPRAMLYFMLEIPAVWT